MRGTDSVHKAMTDAVTALLVILPYVEAELTEKKRNPYGGFGSGKGGHGQLAAWNAQAAMLLFDIHIGARELECNLRYQVAGTIWVRGGSERNTARCIRGLPSLAAGAPHDVAVLVIRKLESWTYRGELILGRTEPLSRLPRLPGESEPRCPYCSRPGTLRVRHATGIVSCLHPACRDSEGRKPAGRIELGAYSGEPMIAWADGMTGVMAA